MRQCIHWLSERPYIVILGTFMIFAVILNQFFLISAVDDMTYSIIGHASFQDIIYFLKWHYNNCNGRLLVHALDIFLLKYDVYLWRILNAVVMTLFVYAVFLIISDKETKKKEKTLIMSISALSIFFLDVKLLQAVAYSPSISLNYLWPATAFLFVIICLKNNYYGCRLFLLALLASATVEQFGLMTVGAIFIAMCYNLWLNNKKIAKRLLILLVLCIAAYSSIIFSGGTMRRTGYEGIPLNLISWIRQFFVIMYNCWFNCKEMKQTMFVLLFCTIYWIFAYLQKKDGKKLIVLITVFSLILEAFNMYLNFNTAGIKFNSNLIFTILWGMNIIISILLFTYVNIRLLVEKNDRKSQLVFLGFLLGSCSQIMLIAVAYCGLRTNFAALVGYLPFVVMTITDFYKRYAVKIKWIKILTAVIVTTSILYSMYTTISSINYFETLNTSRKESFFDGKASHNDVENVIKELKNFLTTKELGK